MESKHLMLSLFLMLFLSINTHAMSVEENETPNHFFHTSQRLSSSLNNLSMIPVSINISSCHDSHSRGGRLVHCCPPDNFATMKVVDFQFPDPSAPKRIRRPAHLVDADYVAKYEKAVGMMKNLPNNHPLNFYRQANVHCVYCTGGFIQSNSSLLFNVHRSWLFFPWHRAMLYFHERILSKLIGDDTFALPYWNWDVPEAMSIPKILFNGSLNDKAREPTHFPPKTVDYNYAKVESGLDKEAQTERNLAFLYTQMVSGAKKPELFMGCKLTGGQAGFCNTTGTVEAAPHNTIHTWVGDGKNPEREDMGSLYSAGRDPMFYVHHANLDRLWSVWKKLHGNKLEFADPAWLDAAFYFQDENLQLVRIKVRDVLNFEKLGYEYEEARLPWLNARPKPAVNLTQARDKLSNMLTNITNSKTSIGDDSHATFTLNKTVTIVVPRPKPKNNSDNDDEEILVVYGIVNNGEHMTKFDVYINLVDENKASVGVREFAGTYVSLSQSWKVVNNGVHHDDKNGKHKKQGHLKLGISEILHDLQADDDESILVTFVPRVGSVTIPYDGVKVEYI